MKLSKRQTNSERRVEEGRVVVRRRGAPLVRIPVTRQDGRPVAMETFGITARAGHLVALSEGEEPENRKHTNTTIVGTVEGETEERTVKLISNNMDLTDRGFLVFVPHSPGILHT